MFLMNSLRKNFLCVFARNLKVSLVPPLVIPLAGGLEKKIYGVQILRAFYLSPIQSNDFLNYSTLTFSTGIKFPLSGVPNLLT